MENETSSHFRRLEYKSYNQFGKHTIFGNAGAFISGENHQHIDTRQ